MYFLDYKRSFFDREKVQRAVDRALRRTLSRFGAFVRTRAKSSIRKRKKVSEPGKPPTNRTGLLKKFIFFGYEAKSQTVVIGPALLKPRPQQTTPELLEYGGVIQIRPNRKVVTANYRARPFMRPAHAAELPKFLNSIKDSVKG